MKIKIKRINFENYIEGKEFVEIKFSKSRFYRISYIKIYEITKQILKNKVKLIEIKI